MVVVHRQLIYREYVVGVQGLPEVPNYPQDGPRGGEIPAGLRATHRTGPLHLSPLAAGKPLVDVGGDEVEVDILEEWVPGTGGQEAHPPESILPHQDH